MLLLLSHFSRVRLCATPQMAAHQAPPSLGFSRREHWSGLPFPSPVCESEVALLSPISSTSSFPLKQQASIRDSYSIKSLAILLKAQLFIST